MNLDREAAREKALTFNLRRLDPGFLDDPYPVYRALREHAPIHAMPDGSFFLSRYDDCLAVYRDPETWSSDKRVDFQANLGASPLYEHHTTSLVFNDPPYHTRVRRLLSPAFTPKALRALEPAMEGLVDRLLDAAEAGGSIDLIGDFAAAIPVQLIGDMLGIPEGERGPLRAWSLAILGALEPVLSPERIAAGVQAVEDFKTYLGGLVARRQTENTGQPGEILSTLVANSLLGPNVGDGERLSELELLHNCIFLLNAGHETTTNLIGNAVDLLIRHPEALAALRAKPDMIESAVEECLRMESSNQLGNRRATLETDLGGTTLAAGSYVHIGIGAANRDPAQFQEPERFDPARAPNRHLAFGAGIHVCAGISLARMEGRVAIGRLVRRFATIEPTGPPTRGGRVRFRGFLAYPVRLGR